MNLCDVEKQAEVLQLYFARSLSIRAIARELSMDRKTVRRIVRRRKILLGLEGRKYKSILDPYKHEIKSILEKHPNIASMAIFNRIREMGFTGSDTVVRKWVQSNRLIPHRSREAFLMLEFFPGECAQVDWGEFGDVFADGVKIHCFSMVLCYSRMLYIEFTRSEKFEDFIRCHENAFKYFGGVPKECWYDNLKTAVIERVSSLIKFNPRFLAYLGHHSIRPHACNPARGNEKGRVEDSIKYIRSNFWAGRRFKDFDDLCTKASFWRDETANKREHRTTRKVPSLILETEERAALLEMNQHTFETWEIASRVVPPNFHIIYETNKYSVPWTLVGMTVTLRINNLELKIYYNERLIGQHIRSYKKNSTFTKPDHIKGLIERKPGTTRDSWQLSAVKGLGPKMGEYLNIIKSGHRSLRRELSKILSLATIYGHKEVHDACVELMGSGAVGVDNLELVLKKRYHPSLRNLQPLNFQVQNLNRVILPTDLRRYDSSLFENQDVHQPKHIGGKKDEPGET